MIDLNTTYLGLKLRTPLVASASPLSQEIDSIRRSRMPGPPPSCSIRFLKSNCDRRSSNWSIA